MPDVRGAEPEVVRGRAWVSRFDVVTWLTVYVVILFGLPSRLVFGPLGSAGAPSMLLGLLSFGIWVLHRIGAPRSTRRRLDPIAVAMFLFLISVAISYAVAMARPILPDEASPADVALLSLLSWSGTLLLAREIPGERRRDTLIWRLSIAGGLLSLLGLAQFLTRRVLVDVISVPGLTAVDDATTFFRDGRIRPVGTSIHPLEYGTILSVLLPFALHVALQHRYRNAALRWAPVLLTGAAIAISSSRTAYLTAIVGLAFAMIGWSRRQRLAIVALGGAGVLALWAVAPRLIESVTALFTGARTDPSIESRTDSFVVAQHFIGQDPFFGRGLGTFLGRYRIFDNQYLLLLVSVGVVGTILFASILVVTVAQMFRVWRAARSAETRALAMTLTASVTSGGLALAFFDAFAFPMTMGALFLIMGIASSLARQVLPKGKAPANKDEARGATLWDFVRACLRRWGVVVLGVAVTGAVGLSAVRGEGVYFARMEIVVLTPTSWYKNVLQGRTDSSIMTAGAVARRVVGAGEEIKYGSLDATLVGISHKKDAYWIRAEDQGGQWAADFRQPIIVVDVVAPSQGRVREIQYQTIDMAQAALDELQDELQVDRTEQMTLQVAPELSVIHYVHGNRTRALGMILVVGGLATGAAVWLVDVEWSRARARYPRHKRN